VPRRQRVPLASRPAGPSIGDWAQPASSSGSTPGRTALRISSSVTVAAAWCTASARARSGLNGRPSGRNRESGGIVRPVPSRMRSHAPASQDGHRRPASMASLRALQSRLRVRAQPERTTGAPNGRCGH
jgi:hypothetical protein